MTTIAVIDHGAGNLVSIEQALQVAGARTVRVTRPAELDGDGLVMPGVGSAGAAMGRLRRQGLDGAVRSWALDGRPFLGICLGMQLLYEASDEDGSTMLGILPGRVRRLTGAQRLPHMGWNQVRLRRPHPLFAGIPDGTDFYFVHSYAAGTGAEPGAGGLDARSATGVTAADPILGVTEYGEAFGSAVADGSLAGVQFHPERSGHDGLRLLANFVAIAGGRP